MSTPAMCHRPIYGGVFGRGRYSLASVPCVANGLHAVRYMVIEPRAGAVLSVSDDKRDALSSARRLLRATTSLAERTALTAIGEQVSLWPAESLPPLAVAGAKPTVSRRRRDVFARSSGRCHYCRAALTLEGTWHVEHMLPRALGGGDEAVNLVAACAPCNLSKSDSTALEFVTSGRA